MKKVTKEMIAKWKKEHGNENIRKISLKDNNRKVSHVCYFKKPSRNVVGLAINFSQSNNSQKFIETLLENCWLGGDEEVKTNDDLFWSLLSPLNSLVELREAEVLKV
jgi:hypothetical protein